MGKLNEIAQKAYECAVRRGKIDPACKITAFLYVGCGLLFVFSVPDDFL